MKQSTLLLLVMIIFTTGIYAQKNQKNQKYLTGYAITASEKGDRAWKEVRPARALARQQSCFPGQAQRPAGRSWRGR